MKMHNSESIINFACVISSLVGVFRWLAHEEDMKGTAILNEVICNLPPNVKESWSSYTVKRN